MDLSQIFEAIKSTYGPPIAIAAGAFYWFWRDRPSKRLDDADNDSSVRAIDFWEKAASRAEALNEELRKRADDFARERNELAVAEERRSEWRLFRLWNFSREPKAFELHPPLDAHVSLTATTFQASFS